MKMTKPVVLTLACLAFMFFSWGMVSANDHLTGKDTGLVEIMRYFILFPGATIVVYVAATLYVSTQWDQLFWLLAIVIPALLLVHFVVSVMNAHTHNAYWLFQVFEVFITYYAWVRTGARWVAKRRV